MSSSSANNKPLQQRSKAHRRAGIERLTSMLTNAERDVLHVELYRYLAWLKARLEEVEEADAGKRTLLNVCASSEGVGECLEGLKGAFKILERNPVVVNDDDGACKSKNGAVKMPLLERVLGDELAKLVVKAPLRGGSHKREQGNFENYWARLMEFKEKHGHCNGAYVSFMFVFDCKILLTYLVN